MVTEKDQVDFARNNKQMRENMIALTEYFLLKAQMTRAKYDGLISAGFTPEQALMVIKDDLK